MSCIGGLVLMLVVNKLCLTKRVNASLHVQAAVAIQLSTTLHALSV